MANPAAPAFMALLRRDRLLSLAGLALISLLAWLYTLSTLHAHRGGGVSGLVMLSLMWIVMMVAMMAPSATPLVLTFAGLSRKRRVERDPVFHTGALVAGYLMVWSAYSLLGGSLQWALGRTGSTPTAGPDSAWAGALFLLAGVYQWSPVKHACLERCRSPLALMMTGWRAGWRGALQMGARHGAHCVTCCWALMALMLVAGIMSPFWLVGLAALCLAEKVLPGGHRISRVAGLGLIGWGSYILVS